jgi:hypothetical protein
MKDNFEILNDKWAVTIKINIKDYKYPILISFSIIELDLIMIHFEDMIFSKAKKFEDPEIREQINIFRIANKLKEFVQFNRAMKGVEIWKDI